MPNFRKPGREDVALDAIELLTNDHQEVADLFRKYEALASAQGDDGEKKSLAEQICTMLTVHAAIEEEIFYPAAGDVVDETELLNEADVEHQEVKDLIAKIQGSDPSDVLYDAQVKVLGEHVRHHVEEEENELFPRVERANLDLDALGAEMAARQEELLTVES